MYLGSKVSRASSTVRADTDSRETTSPIADRCLVGFLVADLGVVEGFCLGIVTVSPLWIECDTRTSKVQW